ncbi:lipase family protein [Rhodohalobacter mucosus]|nr:lipase family protein [Rhodohalobacter mucosus]
MSFTSRLRLLLILFITPALFISCDTSSSNDDLPENDFLVSDNLKRTITQQQLETFWFFAGVPEAEEFITYDVDVHTVVYNTRDLDGNPIQASGAILVPQGIENPGLLSVQHATIFSNDEAPSVDIGISVTARKAIFASAGYITFLPDYLGYGVTEELLHPYQVESSLAETSKDMILAGLEFIQNRNLTSTEQPVNLIGYSEGAYASLALARLIEESAPVVDIGLLSMGAPIFDISATMDDIIQNPEVTRECVPCYAYFLYTYHQLYDFSRPLSDYFQSPYDQVIADGLFNGEQTSQEVSSSLPESVSDLFTAAFIQRYNDGEETELEQAVAENDLFYIPGARVLLVHGDSDTVAPLFNSSDFEQRALDAGKTNYTFIVEEGANHTEGFIPWGFETLDALGVRSSVLANR